MNAVRPPAMTRLAVASVLMLVAVAFTVVLAGGCAKKMQARLAPASAPPSSQPSRAPDALAGPASGEVEAKSLSLLGDKAEAAEAAIQQQIVYTADYRIEVKDAEAAGERVQAIAEQAGGFLSNMTKDVSDEGRQHVSVTVRVPSARFAEALRQIESLGKVHSGNINREDVTREYVDLEARLRNKQRQEARLIELMNRAGKLSDVLTVEQHLSSVQEQIEQLQGELRYLKERVALSTITVDLFEERPPELGKPGPFYVGSYLRSAANTLLLVLRAFLVLLIFVVIVGAPLWLLLAVLLFVLRLRKAARTRPKDT
jgi:hypothetical protein